MGHVSPCCRYSHFGHVSLCWHSHLVMCPCVAFHMWSWCIAMLLFILGHISPCWYSYLVMWPCIDIHSWSCIPMLIFTLGHVSPRWFHNWGIPVGLTTWDKWKWWDLAHGGRQAGCSGTPHHVPFRNVHSVWPPRSIFSLESVRYPDSNQFHLYPYFLILRTTNLERPLKSEDPLWASACHT